MFLQGLYGLSDPELEVQGKITANSLTLKTQDFAGGKIRGKIDMDGGDIENIGSMNISGKTTTKFLQLQKINFIDAVTEHNTCKDYEKGTLRYVSGTVNTGSVQACIYMGGVSEAKFAWKSLTQ